ncbi:hypothetical protein [Candidatus Laterigemmans baculatus]|uniref:hypothetical protein n=1 Tax=Candidatus Laterigemmans baculatus TaxID=2770505 RepID=UPI0013DCC62E|nr:hypothetical protein [Candidatus Laterigemmans baculatus]
MPSAALACLVSLALLVATAATAEAQIGPAAPLGFAPEVGSDVPAPGGVRLPTLRQTLTNNLRATAFEQQEFLRRVEVSVDHGQLDRRLVLALMRYSQRRNPGYPFPYFERALRFEAAKRGVHLPSVAVIASTALPAPLPR